MVLLTIKIRPQRGYTYANSIKQIQVDSSTRLEHVLAQLQMDKRECILYSSSLGMEMPLNTSVASHNLQNGDIIETCSSPMISAVLSAVLADLDSVKALSEEARTPETLIHLLDCCTNNENIIPSDWNADRWTTSHIERRMICLATMKKAIQRNDRFATKYVPPLHDLTSLYNFIKDNKIFTSTSNGHSTGLECFKESATNRNGRPTLCWELVLHKMSKLMLTLPLPESSDLIEPFVKVECERHGKRQNTPSRCTNVNRGLNTVSSTRPHRTIFLNNLESKSSIPTCEECSHMPVVVHADSVCLVATCPFYSIPTCQICFNQNHPVLSTRNHERISLLTDPAARAVLKQKESVYCPEFASGPFAILCALLQAQNQRVYFLNEANLKAKAQLICRSNLYDAQGYHRSAFACIDTLTKKNLVRKEMIHGSEEGKYSLLPEGESLAKYCLEMNTSLDQGLSQMCALPPPCIDGGLGIKNTHVVDIIFDRREDKTFAARFQARCAECSVRCEEHELPAGDYIFRLNHEFVLPLVVERKTWADFADSVQGKGKERSRLECLRIGSLSNATMKTCTCQLCRMKRSQVGRIMFIIEGGRCTNNDTSTNSQSCSCIYCKELRDRHGVSQVELERFIDRLHVEHQCLVHFTRDYNDTIMSLLLLSEILPTVNKERYLMYDEFCRNAQSRHHDRLPSTKKGKVVDISDDELIKMLTLKSGKLSPDVSFKHKIKNDAVFDLGGKMNASTKTSARSSPKLAFSFQTSGGENAKGIMKEDIVEILDDSFISSPPKTKTAQSHDCVINLAIDANINQSLVDLTDSHDSAYRMETNRPKKRKIEHEIVELFDDSSIHSPPKGVKNITVKEIEDVDTMDHFHSSISLIVVSGLYEYFAEYHKDVDKLWQFMYKSRKDQNLDKFSSDAYTYIKKIQNHCENIPLVKRKSIYAWILYFQLHFNIILHIGRTRSSRDRLVNLWEGNELLPSHALPKPPELQCAICFGVLQDCNDSEYLPCAHSFHHCCIRTWWEKLTIRKCPICDTLVQTDTLTKPLRNQLPPRQTNTSLITAAQPQGASLHTPQERVPSIPHIHDSAAAIAREARLRYFSSPSNTAASSLWICPVCTFANCNDKMICEMCDSPADEVSSSQKISSTIPVQFRVQSLSPMQFPVKSPSISLPSTSSSDIKSKTCGACKGIGHNRSSYTAETCPCYYHESEIEYRRKKKEKIEFLKDEKVKQLNEEKLVSEQRAETTDQILSLAADLKRTEERQKKVSESLQKKLKRDVDRLSKRIAD